MSEQSQHGAVCGLHHVIMPSRFYIKI